MALRQTGSKQHQTTTSVKKSSGHLTMAELLAATHYNIPTLKRGQEVSGKVVLAGRQEILVDIGAKSEGVITGRELAGARDVISKLAVGDPIEATVLYPENEAGQVVLSLAKLSGARRWVELEEKKKSAQEIEVRAVEANRGGLICDFAGLRGFLPASQLGGPASQLASVHTKIEDLVGTGLTVRVIEVDRPSNRLIFSQKRPDKRDLGVLIKLLAKVKIGDKYKGAVCAILPFGIFVELVLDKVIGQSGNQVSRKTKKAEPDALDTRKPDDQAKLEGLVHISEISWEKVDDPTGLFKVGDEVEVMVIAKDMTAGRLNLSIKQLLPDPFAKASEKYSKDQKVKGKVARVTPYGVFVSLDAGIEGLVHISKIGPNVVYNAGEEIECEIEAIDTTSRKISLVPVIKEKPILYR